MIPLCSLVPLPPLCHAIKWPHEHASEILVLCWLLFFSWSLHQKLFLAICLKILYQISRYLHDFVTFTTLHARVVTWSWIWKRSYKENLFFCPTSENTNTLMPSFTVASNGSRETNSKLKETSCFSKKKLFSRPYYDSQKCYKIMYKIKNCCVFSEILPKMHARNKRDRHVNSTVDIMRTLECRCEVASHLDNM